MLFRSLAKSGLLAFLFTACALLANAARAQTVDIVNTGGGFSDLLLGLTNDRWVAAEFSVTSAYDVTSVLGWMASTHGGTATAAIYSDGGIVPGDELFSAPFSVAAIGNAPSFVGAQSLSWLLNPGTYWVAFEVRSGQDLFGLMQAPITFLEDYAVTVPSSGWINSGTPIGVHIQGVAVAAPIPEPESYAMLLAGLGLLGLARRRRKVRAS